ncbi:MAG TPA: gamma-glutamylcyclotransferase family protein, partial [Methylomirabilota bacterium]|nr:gamma-glutamylcyclotransferase family protein [Methylomirabilota bacterium]
MFVYGTLMQGFALYHLLESRARCLGRGTVPGRLVSLGDFPGLLDDPRQRVHGELYQTERPEALWRLLDEAEGFDPRDIAQSLFAREVTHVSMADGSVIPAWVYRYKGSLNRAAPIPSGDYRLHAALAKR